MTDDERAARTRPAICVVQDGTGYDAWIETPTPAAEAQALLMLRAAQKRQGAELTMRQLAWWLGGVFYAAWGPGVYVLVVDLVSDCEHMAVREITEEEEGEQTG